MPDSSQRYEVVICGAGVVGLCLAKTLYERGLTSILILEKESEIALHSSGRNSGVLHAGIYYTPGSLKATLCWNGNQRWKAFCNDKGLPILDTGKVLVAKDERDIPTLEKIYDNGTKNGASVDLIEPDQLTRYEPLAKTHRLALVSHDTAVVNPKQVMKALHDELHDKDGVVFKFNCGDFDIEGDHMIVMNGKKIHYDYFVNAAGSFSDRIAKRFGLAKDYHLIPFKGIYKQLCDEKSAQIRGNIYPVPNIENPFLGVHFTKHPNGNVYVGPTALPVFGRENYRSFEHLSPEALDIFFKDMVLFFSNSKFRNLALREPRMYVPQWFFEESSKLVHGLCFEDLKPCSKSGIRSQLVDWRTKELVMDFLVEQSGSTIHILNAVSPAFTCGLTFAEMVVDRYFDL